VSISLSPSKPRSVYSFFNVTITLKIPANYSNSLQVEVIPVQSTSDGSARVKMTSLTLNSSGLNLPCASCLSSSPYELIYAQSTTNPSTPDSIVWNLTSLVNFGLFPHDDQDYPGVDNLTFVCFFFLGYVHFGIESNRIEVTNILLFKFIGYWPGPFESDEYKWL
jgi:hypothetical protein